ncbi:DoxX family protein [Streptomyces sp. NPDC057253]|uniref:DoxX family protein n=1 Tax=Streptomyces sp. NPDC057253 TaxID=3346069 RepID=UPI00363F46BF
MNTTLWVFQSLLAAVFLTVGTMKLVRSRAQLASSFGWVEQSSDSFVKVSGLMDTLVGLGLILPAATDIAPVLVPFAAIGGLAILTGGTAIHLRRSETSEAVGNLVFLVLLGVIVWGRFGPYQF